MKIDLYTYDCTGCGRCVAHCPCGVLKMVDNGRCRFVNVADEVRCRGCRRCERLCEAGAIRIVRQ